MEVAELLAYEKHGPRQESESLADEQQHYGRNLAGSVETQGYDEDVPDEGHPGYQGEPYAPAVNLFLLFFKGFLLDLEPLLNPFPPSEAAHIVSDHTAEPVPGGRNGEAGDGLLHHRKDGDVEGVRAEWDDGRCQQVSQEQAEQSEFFKTEHSYESF